MILFTGGGAVFEAFKKIEDCVYLSFRRTDPAEFREAVSKAEVIVHNAANIGCGTVEEAVADNFLPTFRLVNLCLACNPKLRFIYLGSMSYLAEEHDFLPVEKMTPYAYSKFLGETFCLKSSLPNVHAVRFSTLFYENPKRDGLSYLVSEAVQHNAINTFNGGSARRDFIPLDIAAAYLAKIVRQNPAEKVLNIAAGQETSFGEIALFLKKKFPNLRITDLPVENENQVLSQFSKHSIRQMGEIPFSLEDRIEKYIQRLQAEIQ
jgi:nucleoside-diphosphate-sugar epimerase